MTVLVHRRDWLKTTGGWVAIQVLRPFSGATHLRLVIVSTRAATPASSARDLGITLGLEEAQHAATLFGGSIDTTTAIADSPGEVPGAIGSALARGPVTALIGGDDVDMCTALADVARASGALHLNVTCSADALRETSCRRSSFHVCPSDAMARDALAARSAGDARVVAWDPSLEKFGADTLNRRFEARFKRTMTSESWCGWLAVKVLWESSLPRKVGDASALARYLANDGTSFDGHKGRPLSFRSWDHQLRQPVYVVSESSRSAVEAPSSVSADESSRDVLDRIGMSEARSSCRWSER
jgi:hypothetical protein